MDQDLNQALQEAKARIAELELANNRYEMINASKTHFLATISHELRTPLNVVLGMAQVLQGKNSTSGQLKSDLDLILQAGNDLRILIEELLDFSRLEAGAIKLDLEPIDLNTLLERVLRIATYKVRERPIDLIIDYPLQAPRKVLANEQRLHQVLTNLLDNAVKYTEEGHILVQVKSDPHDATKISISVSDSGMGIAKEEIETIFDKYSQTAAAASIKHTRNEGVGLGLAIVKQLVELMQGTITVTSQLKRGTTFTITLPIVKENANQELIQECRQLSGLQALIVDDNLVRQQVLQQHLSSCHVKSSVLPQSGVVNALREMEQFQNPCQLVVISTTRYDQHIAYLARTIRTTPSLKDVMLVLATSGELLDYEIEQATLSGFNCVINLLQSTNFLSRLSYEWQRWAHHLLSQSLPVRVDQRYRVMLVEDNNLNQKVGKLMLTEIGCDVDLAPDGQSALALLKQKTYDLIFMDIGLPDISGLEVTERYRQFEGDKRHIPIIGLTAHAFTQDREASIKAGMDDYLVKPLLQDQLQAILNKWFPTRKTRTAI